MYTGPFPRKRHSHTCVECKKRVNQGAVACYKAKCTLSQRIDSCDYCRPLQASATYRPPAPSAPRPEVQEIAQWYTLIDEKRRQAIFSALCESDRKQAFQYGLAVSWNMLPQYARDLVSAEWWNGRRPAPVDPEPRPAPVVDPVAPVDPDPWAAARRLAQLSLF